MMLESCPFCGGKAEIAICDCGIGYRIVHSVEDNENCPIARYMEDGATMGEYIYDSKEKAAEAWNTRVSEQERLK